MSYAFPTMLAVGKDTLALAYRERGVPGHLMFTVTRDGGATWDPPVRVATGDGETLDLSYLRMSRTDSGRLLIVDEHMWGTNHLFYSDDSGLSWTDRPLPDAVISKREDWPGRCGRPDEGNGWADGPGFNTEPVIGPIGSEVWHVFSDLNDGTVKYYASENGLAWSSDATEMVRNPEADSYYLYLQDIVPTGDQSFLAAFMRVSRDESCTTTTLLSRSSDGGSTWTVPELLDTGESQTVLGRLAASEDGEVWYLFQDVYFDLYVGDQRYPHSDLLYMISTDSGMTWSAPLQFTEFAGVDIEPAIALTADGPLAVFTSGRFTAGDWSNAYDLQYNSGGTRLWVGSPGTAEERPETMPPIVEFRQWSQVRAVRPQDNAEVWAQVHDEDDVVRVWVEHTTPEGGTRAVDLRPLDPLDVPFRDSNNWWAGSIGSVALGNIVDYRVWAMDADGNTAYSDHNRYLDFGWSMIVPTRFYSQPSHNAGRICLTLTSAVREDYNGDQIMEQWGPKSGALGSAPFQWPWISPGNLNWPCTPTDRGNQYLFDGTFFVGFRSVNGAADPRVIGYFHEVGWSQTQPPVAYSGWSDQDFRLRYEDTGGYGLAVTQESHQFKGDGAEDAVFLEYSIVNTGAAGTLEDVEVALYLDPDIGIASDELAEYDLSANVLSIYDDGQDEGCDCGPGTVAMAVVSGQRPDYVNVTAPNWGNDWEIGIDPDLVAGDPLGPGDMRGTLGIAIDQIAPGDTVHVAFVVIMAVDRTELLLTKLPRARELYAERSNAHGEPPKAAKLIAPPAYTEIWAGSPDSAGVDPSSLLDADFIWETIGKTGTGAMTFNLQLDTYADFEEPLQASAGNATKVTGAFPQSVVVAELEDVGVALFDSTLMYARVVATDGEISTYGPLLPLVIRRGITAGMALESEFGIPDRYALYANYPNPFNPSTTIRFDLPVSGEVSLTLFDLLGRQVDVLERGFLSAGRHVYEWNASNRASGVYLYRLTAGEFVAERTLVLMK
jgi:hypothetical protein